MKGGSYAVIIKSISVYHLLPKLSSVLKSLTALDNFLKVFDNSEVCRS